eukprot:9521012-Alexandrium_andersonii.AAC.2
MTAGVVVSTKGTNAAVIVAASTLSCRSHAERARMAVAVLTRGSRRSSFGQRTGRSRASGFEN